MEGRINRDSLSADYEKANYSETRSEAYGGYTVSPARARYSGRSGASKRRSYYSRREVIPEGKDFLSVQILASGILLLFAMFISLVPSDKTLEVREKLRDALSKQTTMAEASESIKSVISKLEKDEILPEPEKADESLSPLNAAEPAGSVINENTAIDPNVLREINEMSDYAKN